uniref:Ionotropic glutamate receptor L-glutamate and glycine-binding domain-containing protein n=1 Tax=Anopheles coluzzii TaxID=1518534 RepID=A0A6E8WA41_ANOCL
MKLIHNKPVAVYFQSLLLLNVLFGVTQSSLLEMVHAVAAYDNSTDTTGTSFCIFTTTNSSLDKISPLLLPSLLQQYPTTFVTMNSYVDMEIRKLATMVLLDLTAYHYEFPFKFIQKRLNHHPCYKKSAKFVILMSGASFDRKELVLEYLQSYAILNFVLVPVTNSSESVSVYTWNQYTGQELYFRSTDRPVHRFFPDKLCNLNGYQFMMYGITNYPYIMFGPDGTAQGLVPNFLNIVIRKRCNGTTFYTDSSKMHYAMDANFNMQHERFSFKNTFYFREETGIYLVCPVRSVRDFLRHLLKPFSLGIWLILGGLFALCRVAEILFPNIYRYDLIAVTFFGGGGVEYRQPFAFRIVTLTLAVLMFFLSEAYNTKIISLMSLEKFTEQPQTLDAIQQSDLRIMFSRGVVDIFSSLKNNFLSPSATMRARKRYGHGVYEHYCAMMYKGNAWIAVAPQMIDLMGSLYMVPEPLMINKLLIQLMQHSPFFDLFERMFGLVNECGLWAYMLKKANVLLFPNTLITWETMLQEVIFFFDDLYCVWILIMVGWLFSTVCFVGEIALEAWRERRRRRVVKKFQIVRKYRLARAWFNVK